MKSKLIENFKYSEFEIKVCCKMISESIKIFCYGTLKKDQPNHHYLVEREAKFLCNAKTVDKYPLLIGTVANIPFLLNKKGSGKVLDSLI